MTVPKLVRDRIPQIIRRTGVEPNTTIAGPEDYRALLREKLSEEVQEFLDSDDPAELADILEVVLAIAADLGIEPAHLEKLREDKALERGGFAERIVWHGNEPTPPAA
jgi:predicted house-cleaning noncanonical NTP pyrophosphatase (MazG superfamily)